MLLFLQFRFIGFCKKTKLNIDYKIYFCSYKCGTTHQTNGLTQKKPTLPNL